MASSHPQLDLLDSRDVHLASVLAKVEGLIPWQVYDHLSKCGKEELYRTCKNCGDWQTFYYRCSLKFCPRCNLSIARERLKLIRLFALRVKQPKHIVLTVRNSEQFTRKRIRSFQKQLARLRRLKIWRSVLGGCVSMEVTNEGRGWHLHAHILAEVRWMPADELARTWAKLVGQDFAIVKVMDAREKTYLGEVCKYVVKGSQLASWEPEEIAQFINSIRGVRFFSTFGTLFKLRQTVKAELDFMRNPPKPCACGCSDFKFETEVSSIVGELRRR